MQSAINPSVERSGKLETTWTINDVLPEGEQIDFTRPFLPESLVGADALEFLDEAEKLSLNQIRGHSYLHIFGHIEESLILRKSPMAVLLMRLHLELLTQRHFLASARDGEELDPHFRSFLRVHWLEEAQRARVDELKLKEWTQGASASVRARAVAEYFDMLRDLEPLLLEQARLDQGGLMARIGRVLTEAERAAFMESQHRSYREVFMVTGMAESLLSDVLRELWAESALEYETAPVVARFGEMRTWRLNA